MADVRLLPTQDQVHDKAAQQHRRGGGRLAELDVLRGFIMGVMALDHTVDLVCRCVLGRVAGSKNFNKEEWSGEPTYPSSNYGRNRFATRFITDLCAPCFCLLMGTGMVLLSESRRAKGWSNGQILRFHLLRGVILFFPCSIIIEHYGFSLPSLVWGTNTFDKLHAWVITSVLVCFSICMVCTALWLYALAAAFGSGPLQPGTSADTSTGNSTGTGTSGSWRPRMSLTLLAGLGTFVLSDRFVAHAAHTGTTADNASERYDAFTGLMFLPAQYGKLYVLYPVFPWVSLCFCGCALGWWLNARRQDPSFSFLRLSAWGSVLCLSLFVVIRLLAGFGNFSQLSLDSNTTLTADGVRFFDVVKYPPSIAYASLTLGLDFLAISLCQLLDRAANKRGWRWRWTPWASKQADSRLAADGVAEVGQSFSWGFWYPFLALGRSPLFFYLMHLWVLGLVGSCFRGGSPFWVVYLVWPLVVAALVPLCDRYSEFKQSKPVTSLWRLF